MVIQKLEEDEDDRVENDEAITTEEPYVPPVGNGGGSGGGGSGAHGPHVLTMISDLLDNALGKGYVMELGYAIHHKDATQNAFALHYRGSYVKGSFSSVNAYGVPGAIQRAYSFMSGGPGASSSSSAA